MDESLELVGPIRVGRMFGTAHWYHIQHNGGPSLEGPSCDRPAHLSIGNRIVDRLAKVYGRTRRTVVEQTQRNTTDRPNKQGLTGCALFLGLAFSPRLRFIFFWPFFPYSPQYRFPTVIRRTPYSKLV